MKLIKPSPQIMEACHKFAEQSAASSMDEYARRNQHSIDKIKLDIFRGKVAEFQVWQHLVDRARDVTAPDVAIYDKYQDIRCRLGVQWSKLARQVTHEKPPISCELGIPETRQAYICA